MDCLDRTNVVQSTLARWTLNRQLTDLGVLSRGETFTSDLEFEVLFRKIWADNADVVSKSYSGTGALKTDFTRTGKRTFAGALQDLQNSIGRYARNNFKDGPKQDAFDLFLGYYLPDTRSSLVFADKRPLLIQSIPYILAFSMFFVFVGAFTRRLPDAAVLPVRIFIIFWFIVGAWCFKFIYGNGMLYVSLQTFLGFHSLTILRSTGQSSIPDHGRQKGITRLSAMFGKTNSLARWSQDTREV